MSKWFAGILATICGGVVLWWLTHEGGPLNPAKPQPSLRAPTPAHIVFTAFQADPARLNSNIIGRFTVYNDGETIAEGCNIYHGRKTAEEGGIGESSFALPPKQSTTISTSLVWTGTDPNTHSIRVIARVYCKNGVVSDTTERVIPVQQ
jgi:hypothetical protein